MRLKSVVAVVTIGSFLFGTTAPAFAADRTSPKAISTHSVASADLHRTAQISHEQATAVRDSLNAFLARPDVKSQLSRFGMGTEKVASQIARLNDAELGRIQQQLMAADLQLTPAGIPRGALIAIIVGGSVMIILVVILVAVAASDVTDPYYYY
jgi:hypothetical protein